MKKLKVTKKVLLRKLTIEELRHILGGKRDSGHDKPIRPFPGDPEG